MIYELLSNLVSYLFDFSVFLADRYNSMQNSKDTIEQPEQIGIEISLFIDILVLD